MKLELINNLEHYSLQQNFDLNVEINDAYTSDLLSDVVANAPEDSVLITIQAHKNSLAVAALVGMKAIILCNDRKAPADLLREAAREEIAIFSTTDNQFQASIKLGKLLAK